MSYAFYLDGMLLPVAPPSLELQIQNKNRTLDLINEGEVNLLKEPGLTDVSFDARVPQERYPFAAYAGGFTGAQAFLDRLVTLKQDKRSFRFIVTRTSPTGAYLFDTNMEVSLEEYTILEDAGEGFDLLIDIALKQYKAFETKTVEIRQTPTAPVAVAQSARSTASAPQATSHTVVGGDCLYNIARQYYGEGSRWREIYALNTDKIQDPDRIYPGQVLTLPTGRAA